MKTQGNSKILKVIALAFGIVIFMGALIFANYERIFSEESGDTFFEFETGRIIQIIEDNTFVDETSAGNLQGNMVVELEILTGRHAGERVEATYHLFRLVNVHFSEGDRVSIRVSTMDGELSNVNFDSFERREVLVASVIIFFLLLVLIGGKRGLMSVIGLVFTMVCIIFLLIPLMLKGFPVILTTIGILILVTFVTLYLLFGISAKSVTAILGCGIGVVAAAVIGRVVGDIIYISGYHMEDIQELLIVVQSRGYGLQAAGLFTSGILIASLGAVMDTAVSIASAMEEIQLTNPNINKKQLFKSGMNVGRDVMGTMSNTLILAFAGTALNMVILIYASHHSFNQFINSDFIALEIIRGIAGSMGIVLTVPAVAFIGANLLTKWNSKNQMDA